MSGLSRRRFLELAAGALGSAAALATYARFIEPHWIQVVRRRMPVPGLPAGLSGSTLAQISDLHVGRVAPAYLISVLELVRGLEPDRVVYTGDFVSWRGPHVLDALSAVLAHAPTGRHGAWAILGNHDYGPGWSHPEIAERVAERVTRVGIRVLRNERVDMGGLALVGCDDVWAHRFDLATAFAGHPDAAPALVLSHNPDTLDLPGWVGRGWVLAGHTHGGQVRPPFLPPPLLPINNPRYAAGEVDVGGGRRLYVNRGVGHLLPVRFNVRPEVTLFELQAA